MEGRMNQSMIHGMNESNKQ